MDDKMELIGSNNVHAVHYNNDHDEEEENDVDQNEEKSDNDDEPDFMDKSGKLWNFACRIQDEEHLKQWCHEMGELRKEKEEQLTDHYACPIENCEFEAILLKSQSIMYSRNKHNHHDGMERGEDDTNKETLNLRCTKLAPNGRCQYVGIYLKENGCLYTRGEHEHSENGKTPINVGDNFIDIFGKSWEFKKEICKNNDDARQNIFSNEFGFSKIRSTQTSVNLYCHRKGPKGTCKFAGVYLKANGCLYMRGQYECEKKQDQEEHLEIVAEVNRGKWLPQMKREGEQRPQEWPMLEVDGPGADERLRRFVQRPCLTNVKKEEPMEEDDQLEAANGASQSLVNQCNNHNHQEMVNRDKVPASTPALKPRYALRPRNGLKLGLLAANVHYDWLPPIPANNDEMNAANKKKKSKIQKKK